MYKLLICESRQESSELIYEDALNSSSGQNQPEPSSNIPQLGKNNDQDRSTSNQLNRSFGTRAKTGQPSNVVFINNLTRPFTVNQLKELLGKYGTLKSNPNKQPAEPYFWIDAVKSHCYVAYETEAEAESALKALDSITWPASNPKQLSVVFSSMDEIVSVIENDGHKPVNKTTNGDDRGRAGDKERDRKVREWDLPKMKEDQESPATNGKLVRKDRKEKQEADEPQAPPKTLDDLFRKTNTTPFIYWLPLTQEQYMEKCRLEEKRRIEREARRAKENQPEETRQPIKTEKVYYL